MRFFSVLFFLGGYSVAEIISEKANYIHGDLAMQGYIAYDGDSPGKRPVVLVVHEWWGQNEYARKRARMLAKLGYLAMALDMYGEGKIANHPASARQFTEEVMADLSVAEGRFLSAVDRINTHPLADGERIAAIGYCFGGALVLQMARTGLHLKGVVSFHGGLSTRLPVRPGTIKSSILVCHGQADSFISTDQIESFKTEMKEAGANLKFISYKGAKHGFTNPAADVNGRRFDLPLAYHPRADKKSWKEMKKFLARVFK